MRAKVWRCRLTSSLFNTKKYASDLERLYRRMWTVYQKGQPVDHITEPWN